MTLLLTKLHIPPQRPGAVRREGLMARLDGALDRTLILLSSPAGYGKSSLMAQWAHERGSAQDALRFAWVSLDASDNDPLTLVSYLVAAFQTTELEAVAEPWSGAPTGSDASWLRARLADRLNSLAVAAYQVVCVLDDVHLLHEPAALEMLAFLLEHAPPNLHLALLTRADPPLPLAAHRARGQLLELRAPDLRFGPEETARFFGDTMGLDLSPSALSALEERTEGWVAGLQLAALSLQGRPGAEAAALGFTGEHRFVAEYLTEQILAGQPERVQEFLVRTAILDRLTAPLCQEITGFADAHELLERLYRQNLFLEPLDDAHRCYRYHALFADSLRQQLARRDPALPDGLRAQAARWCARNELPVDAIEYALAAGDEALAAALVADVVRSMVVFDERVTLRDWLRRLPPALVAANPWLGIGRTFALIQQGDLAGARHALGAARASSAGAGDAPGEADLLDGLLTGAAAWIAEKQGDLPGTLRLAEAARAHLPERSPLRLFVTTLAGDVFFLQGQLDEAERLWGEVLRQARALERPAHEILMRLGLGHIAFWRGQLAEAEAHYESALALILQKGASGVYEAAACASLARVFLGRGQVERALPAARRACEKVSASSRGAPQDASPAIVFAQVHLAMGEDEAAERALHEAEASMRSYPPYANVLADWQYVRVSAWLARGELAAALRWAQDRPSCGETVGSYGAEWEGLAQARALLAAHAMAPDALTSALAILQELARACEARGHTGRLVDVLVELALAHKLEGQGALAAATLGRARDLAADEAYLQPFAQRREAIGDLLRELARAGRAPQMLQALELALPTGANRPPAAGRLPEALTGREQDVLRLLAAGLSNAEIGRELFLSVNTIKTHLRGVYGKLGVTSRVQAVSRARELGLL